MTEQTPNKEESLIEQQPTGLEEKETSPEEKAPETKPKEKKMDIIIFLLLLIPAIMKDIIEVVLGLIPGIQFFVWLIALPFSAYILFISIITGMRTKLILSGQLIDLLPIASILPITTGTVIFAYLSQGVVEKITKKSSKA
ncbi:MAG: hypothetical protein PHG13_01215 [Candidatus Pacebacteria bacterium]|nr:hypothetical protein [Candidatus Paceibacterota bacterium]MDD5721924.1 hypothetical protein [Candidatus Paceibacterota bacterium]